MKEIEDIFKSLNEKRCKVSSSGLHVEGSMEGAVILRYTQYHGLQCFAELEWNTNKIHETVNRLLVEIREEVGLTYAIRDAIIEKLIPVIKQSTVQVASISSYNIKTITTKFRDKKLDAVDIIYETGNLIQIQIVQ